MAILAIDQDAVRHLPSPYISIVGKVTVTCPAVRRGVVIEASAAKVDGPGHGKLFDSRGSRGGRRHSSEGRPRRRRRDILVVLVVVGGGSGAKLRWPTELATICWRSTGFTQYILRQIITSPDLIWRRRRAGERKHRCDWRRCWRARRRRARREQRRVEPTRYYD